MVEPAKPFGRADELGDPCEHGSGTERIPAPRCCLGFLLPACAASAGALAAFGRRRPRG